MLVATAEAMAALIETVSFNPWRVFVLVATHHGPDNIEAPGNVSIPGGFSCSLRPRPLPGRQGLFWMFQSLAGFRARCDGIAPGQYWFFEIRFNPWRVFVLVATVMYSSMVLLDSSVSIPGGFSCSLRRRVQNGPFALKSFLKSRKSALKKWMPCVPGLFKGP